MRIYKTVVPSSIWFQLTYLLIFSRISFSWKNVSNSAENLAAAGMDGFKSNPVAECYQLCLFIYPSHKQILTILNS